MLRWAFIFLLVAMGPLLFSSGPMAGLASSIGQMLLMVAMVVATLSMLVSADRRSV